MNNWKKMTFVLALAAGLCGGAWAQDGAHRDGDRDRDDQQWGNRDRDPDGRYRNDPNYQYRNGQWVYVAHRPWDGNHYGPTGGYGWYNYAHQIGYNDGVNDGRIDRRFNRGYRPERDGNFKHADHGYDRYYGDKGAYREAYRDGYLAGYRSGFGRW